MAVTVVAVATPMASDAGVLAVIVGEVMSVMLLTVTEIAAVAVLPAASRAVADTAWTPLAAVVLLQEME